MTKEQELKVMALEDHYIDALKKGELDDYPDGYFTTEKLTALILLELHNNKENK